MTSVNVLKNKMFKISKKLLQEKFFCVKIKVYFVNQL